MKATLAPSTLCYLTSSHLISSHLIIPTPSAKHRLVLLQPVFKRNGPIDLSHTSTHPRIYISTLSQITRSQITNHKSPITTITNHKSQLTCECEWETTCTHAQHTRKQLNHKTTHTHTHTHTHTSTAHPQNHRTHTHSLLLTVPTSVFAFVFFAFFVLLNTPGHTYISTRIYLHSQHSKRASPYSSTVRTTY